MVPFLILLLSLLILRGLGAVGIGLFAAWQTDAAYALALMLLLTGSAHFTKTKEDLIGMVPAAFPYRRQIVTITGFLELLGAIGLIIPATRGLAAYVWPCSSSPCSPPTSTAPCAGCRCVGGWRRRSGCARPCSSCSSPSRSGRPWRNCAPRAGGSSPKPRARHRAS